MFLISSVMRSRRGPLLEVPATQIAEDWKLPGVLSDRKIQNPFNKMSDAVAGALSESMIVTAQTLPQAVSFFRSARTDSVNFNRFTWSIPSMDLLINRYFPTIGRELVDAKSFALKHTITHEKTPNQDSIILYAKWIRSIADVQRLCSAGGIFWVEREEKPFFMLVIGVMIFGSGNRALSLEVVHYPSLGAYGIEVRLGPKKNPLNLSMVDPTRHALVEFHTLTDGGPQEFYLYGISLFGPQETRNPKKDPSIRIAPLPNGRVLYTGDVSFLSRIFDDIYTIFDANDAIIDRIKSSS